MIGQTFDELLDALPPRQRTAVHRAYARLCEAHGDRLAGLIERARVVGHKGDN